MPEPLKPTYAEKRAKWIEALTCADPHSICNQIASMTWNVAAYRIIYEARLLAPPCEDGGVQLNGLLHNLLDRGFFESHALSVRRLVDASDLTGKWGVFSLLGLIKSMCEHSSLFTRAEMLAVEGVHNEWQSQHRNAVLDELTNTDERLRTPGDVISKEWFESIKTQLEGSSNQIKAQVDKYIAHAAIPESRASVSPAFELSDLWSAHEVLCRVAACLARCLGVSLPQPLPYPLFDPMIFIDRPLATADQVNELRRKWRSFADESGRWKSCNGETDDDLPD
jgi:hypothetical protein